MTEFREFQDGEVIAGTRYRVVRLIGVGGMGSVYEVEHIELGKRFVLKALLRELARREDLAQRLRNEWRALARLQHANIVNVTDAGTSNTGVPFYVMERLDGDSLAGVLRQKRRLHVLEAVGITAAVLDALSAAHDIGIIHRDVKPANVFIVAGGGVKLLDFGIAKIADANSVVTARGLAVGTPRYMSPEQARGERVDGRSDLYAAALILFEMVAGVGPFDDARDANELLLAHLAREAPPLSSLVMGVSPELERILASMLAKDCRQRPAHARDGAQLLRDFAVRQRTAPATDAPTGEANYGADTLAASRRPTPSPIHEVPTRADGPVQRRASEPSLTDNALTQRMELRHDTTQVTESINSVEAFSVSSVPNTTFVSPPSFDGSTTQRMVSPLPYAAPPSWVPSPPPPVERPERTEMLGEIALPLPLDALPTNTSVPLPERARPVSLTPPPVVDTGRQEPSAGAGPRRARLGAAIAGGLCLVAALALAASRSSSTNRAPAAAANDAPGVVATAASVPSAPAQPAHPAQVAVAPDSPVPSAALASATPAPAAAPSSRMISDGKRLSSAAISAHALNTQPPAGPFLRAIPARKSVSAPSAPATEPAMPGSGL